MDNFDFWCGTKIIFGRDSEERVGKEVATYSKKILLHYGGGSIKKSGLYAKVVSLLNDEGIEVFELPGVVPNPRLSLVRKGIKLCRDEKIDFILAIGGGSVIDSAKAIAVGAPATRDVWDYFLTDLVKPKEALPIGTILTIPAAGSEASPASVITDEEHSRKLRIFTDLIRPKFSILNPEYTKTLPPEQTAYGVVDMLGHIIERYFTNTKNVDLTDKLCESTMKSIIKNAELAMKEPDNYDYRAELMWASTIAHCGLLGTGRQEDWATHLLEHELSAIYDIAHGAGLAVLYPAWMKFVYKNDVRRFTQFAEEVWGIREGSDEEKALASIEALRNFYKKLGVATTLKELEIDDSNFEKMADALVARWKTAGSFVKIGKEEALEIYRLALY